MRRGYGQVALVGLENLIDSESKSSCQVVQEQGQRSNRLKSPSLLLQKPMTMEAGSEPTADLALSPDKSLTACCSFFSSLQRHMNKRQTSDIPKAFKSYS